MKVTILRNFVQNQDSLNQGLAMAKQLLSTINSSIEFTVKDTTKILSAIPLNSDVVNNGFMVDPQPILDSVDGSEDIACMVYDWSRVKPQPTNPVTSLVKKGNAVPMQIPEQWYGFPKSYPEVFAQFFLHELCHALYFLTGTPNDRTHYQYQNPAYSQRTPTDYYLFLISTMNKTQTIPTVNIKRGASDSKQTIGQLTTTDGQFGCNTMERAWLNNQQNVSCIPTGTYNCQWKFMLRKLSYHYQIMNVPGRSGIFIHAGNYFFDSAGCIILGSQPQDINKDGELDLINSRVILSAFEAKMGKKPFNLVIQ